MSHRFSKKTKYVRTDAWRGYLQPEFALVGWNDTGMFSDSPCKTDVGLSEAKLAKDFLKKNNIPFRTMTCESSNVFCVHHYLITPPEFYNEAMKKVIEWYSSVKEQTRLLYIA